MDKMNPTKLINFLKHPGEYPECPAKEKLSRIIKKMLENEFVCLEQSVYSIQTNCSCYLHENEAVMRNNPDYCVSGIGTERLPKIFTGTRCKVCKRFTPRGKGPRKKICRGCGGDMCNIGLHPFPLTKKKVRTYKCSMCGLIEF